MAYIDQKSPSQRAVSLISAAILQGGVGAILIYGLATTYFVRPPDTPIQATDFPLPPPEHKPDPTPSPTEANHPKTTVDQPTPPLDTQSTGPTFAPDPKTENHPYLPPAPPTFAPPPPPPTQFFKPTPARPIGDRARWVTTDDYPASEIRGEHTGVTGYVLSIAANGRVSRCEVMKSSGWPKLDEAACANVSKRARFEAGTDTSGAKTAGSYSGSVVWTIPR